MPVSNETAEADARQPEPDIAPTDTTDAPASENSKKVGGRRAVKETKNTKPASIEAATVHTPTEAHEARQRRRPTIIEIFTGQAIATHSQMVESLEATDTLIAELQEAQAITDELDTTGLSDRLQQLGQIRTSIQTALENYTLEPWMLWLYQWSLVVLLVLCGLFQVVFIELYARWHGAYFISFDLYNPVNIDALANINFVGGATTMSIAAEVLMWSSLGVWAQQSYANTMLMVRRQFRFAEHGPQYIGILMRNTSVAAIVVILLRLSKFSLFGVSLEEANPLAFDATIGLSFLLGFFGDDAYRILSNFKDRVVDAAAGKKDQTADTGEQQSSKS